MKWMMIALLTLFAGNHKTSIHQFHVSITQIEHNSESKKLEIMLKLFTDDLSQGLNNFCGSNMHLGTQQEPPQANDQLMKYVLEHFSITANGKTLNYSYLGKQKEDDATWIYLESEKVKSIKKLSVENSILTQVFDDQANIINLKLNGNKYSLALNKKTPAGEFSLKP